MSEHTQKVATKAEIDSALAAIHAEAEAAEQKARKANAPRIYVACLAAYNSGHLHGRWIDLTESTDDTLIHEQIAEMLAESPVGEEAEEFEIHDTDNLPSWVTDVDQAVELAEVLEEISPHDWPAYFAFCRNWDEVQTADDFTEAFAGIHSSAEDYAMQLAEDCAGSREELEMQSRWPFNCIDWEQAARELEIGGDIWVSDYLESEGGYAVFRNI